jgi:hypothetical protein
MARGGGGGGYGGGGGLGRGGGFGVWVGQRVSDSVLAALCELTACRHHACPSVRPSFRLSVLFFKVAEPISIKFCRLT